MALVCSPSITLCALKVSQRSFVAAANSPDLGHSSAGVFGVVHPEIREIPAKHTHILLTIFHH
jgi:hypothetical protein